MSPRITVVVPVYNVEKYIQPSIESILNQTFPDFELILVNDGSTDRSADICECYARKDRRVIVLHQQNAGFGEARNTGVKHARGEYVYFMDSDDLVDPDLLKHNYALAKRHEADVVLFGHRKLYSSSRVQNAVEMVPSQRGGSEPDIIHLLNNGFGFAVWEQLIRTSVIKSNQLIFPAFQREADVAFLLEFYQYCNRLIVNPRVYYVYNSFYSSAKFNVNSTYNHKRLYERLLNLVLLKGKKSDWDRTKAKFFVLWFCHVVPINYVAAAIPLREQLFGLASLLADEEIKRWFIDVRTPQGFLQKLSLFVFRSNSAWLMWVFTNGKLLIKRNVRINFKKLFYR